MSRFLSSIFNFKTLYLGSVPRNFWNTIGVVVSLLATAEIVSRILLIPVGNFAWAYWSLDAIDKFEWYRSMSENDKAPDVVAIGDSTGARGFDPRYFSKASEKTSYNLAWPANFPKALRATTHPLLQEGTPPDSIILIQSPGGYIDSQRAIRFENSILSSQIAKRYPKNDLVSDYVYLSRLYAARSLLKKSWIDHQKIVSEPKLSGFMPAGTGSKKIVKNPGETQKKGNKKKDFSQERLICFLQLAEITENRGIRLIVVLPPVNSGKTPVLYRKYLDWLHSKSPDYEFTIWDLSNPDFLRKKHFWDKNHLNELGAKLFSLELGKRYKKHYGKDNLKSKRS